MYKGVPELAEREGRDYFIRALPNQLIMAVAAANPLTVNGCMDHVNRLCVNLDTEEAVNEFKRVRRVWKEKGDSKGEAELVGHFARGCCWDCGKTGHQCNRCPEHFKFKPKVREKSTEKKDMMEVEEDIPAPMQGNDRGSQ